MKERLEHALSGRGSAVLISGEAGIGKTRLLEEFCRAAEAKGARVIAGAAMHESLQPFLIFSKALRGILDGPLFPEQEQSSFSTIFAVDGEGRMLARSESREGAMAGDAIAGALSTVQTFVRDYFSASGSGAGSLGSLEYGDTRIIMEHGEGLFLAGVVAGAEHARMRESLRRALTAIEGARRANTREASPERGESQMLEGALSQLGAERFSVRRDLESVKLDVERMKVSENVLRALANESRERPLVIVLEDMHWADAPSLFVLSYLARNIRGERILAVCTARIDEGAQSAEALSRIIGEGIIAEMPLRRLSGEDVARIIDSALPGNAMPGEFSERVARECTGNPFFVTELLAQMVSDGAVARADGRYVLARNDYTIPSSVGDLVHARLGALEPETMSMAEYASCIGREFDSGTALSLSSVREPGKALDALASAGIIALDGERGRFVHALFQDAVYNSISQSWRAAHHRSIGNHLERERAGDIDSAVFELARHFSRSGEHSKGFAYCVRAGEKAESAFAPEQAIDFYESALALLPKVLIGDDVAERTTDICERLGDMHSLSGEFERARDFFGKVITSSADPQMKAKIRRKISIAFEKQGDFDSALSELSTGISLVGDESLERWRLESQRAWVLLRKGAYDEVESSGTKAVEMLSRFEGGGKGIAVAYNALGGGCQHRCMFDRALEYYSKGIEIRERLGDTPGLAALYNNIANVHSDRGETGKAEECYERSIAAFEKMGDRLSTAMVCNNYASVSFSRGDLAQTLAMYMKAMGLLERIGSPFGLGMIYGNVVHVYLKQGEFAKCREYNEKALAIREKLGDKHGMVMSYVSMGELESRLKDYRAAVEWFEKAINLSKSVGIGDFLPVALTNMANAFIEIGELGKAEGAISEAESLAKASDMKRESAILVALRGALEAAKGDFASAEKFFESGTAALRSMGDEMDAANFEVMHAQALAKAGETGRAIELLSSLLPLCEKNGWNVMLEEARAALARLEKGQIGITKAQK